MKRLVRAAGTYMNSSDIYPEEDMDNIFTKEDKNTWVLRYDGDSKFASIVFNEDGNEVDGPPNMYVAEIDGGWERNFSTLYQAQKYVLMNIEE